MKHIIVGVGAALMLSACASAPKGYGPAYDSEFGFRNTQIQNDRFRVSYTSRNAYKSRDFALLRAAEIADIEGYSHFKIIDGERFDNGPGPLVGGQVGIGSGYGYNNSHIGIGVDDVVRAVEGAKVTETIEIVLLNSGSKTDPDIYDAKGVLKSIRPATVRNPSKAP